MPTMKTLIATCLLVLSAAVGAQSFSVTWVDPTSALTYKIDFPPEVLSALAGAVAQVTPGGVVRPIRPPQIVLPGDGSRAVMPDGSIISLGANGEVYRDGQQLPGVLSRQAIQFGVTIYAQGKTNPLWWKWTGAGWTQVTAYDISVLKDYSAMVAPMSVAPAAKRQVVR